MNKRNNAGFSLIETLVAIAVLALIVIPTGSGMVMSFRMNAKTESLMQSQLKVSSAVETLMAEGYNAVNDAAVEEKYSEEGKYKLVVTPRVEVNAENPEASYDVNVSCKDNNGEVLVSVDTHIRYVAPDE